MENKIIQNLACFEVELDPKSHRVYFNEDVLDKDAIIEDIVLYFNDPRAGNGYQIGNPFSLSYFDANDTITSSASIADVGLFVNISDAEKEYVSNLFFKEIQSIRGDMDKISYLNLNRKIESGKSFFQYGVNATVRFLCYITYRTEPKTQKALDISGSFTVDIPIGFQVFDYSDIKLSDFIPEMHKEKKIKKITIPDLGFGYGYSFLYLKSDKFLIENIPLVWLWGNAPNTDLYFDNLNIDFTESILRYRSNVNVEFIKLTFFY